MVDTTAAAQAVQDALQRRLSGAEKLAQVARLSRTVDVLSVEGLRRRHPTATDDMIRDLRAELRLGSIASSVHGEPRSTQDVDMVVALLDRHVTPFAKRSVATIEARVVPAGR